MTKQKVKLEIETDEYTCGEAICCHSRTDWLVINGVRLMDIDADTRVELIKAVLEHLGYEAET